MNTRSKAPVGSRRSAVASRLSLRGIRAIALLATATLALADPAAAIWPFDPVEDEPLGDRAAKLLARAIAIPTAAPDGDEGALARLYVEKLRESGLEARLVPTPGVPGAPAAPAPAAAWARWPGTGKARPIVLLSHLDVVPPGPTPWEIPPFEGRITAAHVVGRGALDAKGVSVIHLLTLAELARREPLSRDVIFLATSGEENGGAEGAGYIASEMPQLLGDAEFLLTEGGAIRIAAGTPPVWGVTVTEKSPCWLELTTRGTPGHAAVPPPDAAVPRLVAALERIRRVKTPVRVLPEVERMYRAMASAAAPQDVEGYRALRDSLARDAGFRSRFLADPSRRAVVRDTLSITVLEGSDATNSIPARARARIDARLLPGQSCEHFTDQLRTIVGDEDVRMEPILSFEAGASPAGTPLYEAISRVAAKSDPDALVVPRLIPGFTDAHYFRALGITAYGFTPRWLTVEETRGIHGPNERISIANLERGVLALVAILEELSALDRESVDGSEDATR